MAATTNEHRGGPAGRLRPRRRPWPRPAVLAWALLAVVDRTMQPTRASLWLRSTR